MASSRRTRILILGGGFGGVYTAMALEKRLGRDPDVEIGLVSRDNYLVFQPMLAEVISGTIGLMDTLAPIRRLCPNTNLYTRTVEGIDLDKRIVSTSSGFRPRPYQLEYDHLVMALGSITDFTGQPGLREHAFPFKYLGDALVLRNHIIHALEEADIETDPELRRALLTFVVAGGGFSGVEVAAQINDFVRKGARSFRNLTTAQIRVVLLAGARILPELPEDLAAFAHRKLQRRGVEIRLATRLAGATADYALLQGGDKIPTKTLVSTVPAAPNPLVAGLPCKKERGRIVVTEHLEVADYPGVWAIGDCAWVPDRLTGGQPCPPTAQHATRQATACARNIAATLRGRPKRPFAFRAVGKLGGLGHHSAVAEILDVKLSGFLAWLLWRAIYLTKLPGVDRKLRVATDWLLDLFLKPDIVQLRARETPGVGREHFEAHETIFEQGDRGDRLYIIVDGEVEVVKKEPDGREAVLAVLGPGECFGEMALVSDLPRMASAHSRTSVNLLTVDRVAFGALFAALPPLRGLFQQLIEQRTCAESPAESTADAIDKDAAVP